MSHGGSADTFFIGWDVGGWNCDNNRNSRDAIVIIDSELAIVGKPWRGNLRTSINESANSREFLSRLFSLCATSLPEDAAYITLAIDATLGFSEEFLQLLADKKHTGSIGQSRTNPYLFRQTERYLFERGLTALSPLKDMIGSQATKAMHVVAKFAPELRQCGVWGNEWLTVIEAYPAACKHSESARTLQQQVNNPPQPKSDEEDALICALVAHLFTKKPETLITPGYSVPVREGWIWVPNDISPGA
jgi:predicted nuclease with RNAse H fold